MQNTNLRILGGSFAASNPPIEEIKVSVHVTFLLKIEKFYTIN
jgi:hypothetical protein